MMAQNMQDAGGDRSAQWDVRTLHLQTGKKNWGIESRLLGDVMDILAVYGQPDSYATDNSKLSFPMFRDLMSILSGQGKDISALNDAVIDFRKQQELPLRFNNKWVLVVGTGNETFSEQEQLMSEALGKALARAGYGMVCGGWDGVDEATAKSFSKCLEKQRIDERSRLLILLEHGQKNTSKQGRIEQLKPGSSWYEEALKRAGALIMIGGRGGAYSAFRTALELEMPVLPIPGTGGDALLAYHELLRQGTLSWNLPLKNLDRPLRSGSDAWRIAEITRVLLQQLPLEEVTPLLTEDEFRKMVNARYAKQEVVVLDDLQKRRWGGQAERDGKVLEAAVTRSAVPGLFDITLNVKAAPGSSLQGNVAFFLHNSFQNEIEYAYAVKGIAQIQMTAYEAFTAAAFTENGTMLELDLNLEEGYPEGFYYKDTATTFQERVAALYHTKSITVPDDLQKGRWGGLPIKNGKVFSARVSKALLPGYFKIVGELRSENKNELQGDVAFFLHDSFISEIIYRKVRGGLATFHITAYEAFTLGAYTEDGTELELDLQRQPGYPEGFYYEEEQAEQPARQGRKKK